MASKRDIMQGIGWANGLAIGIVIGSSIGLLLDNFVLGMGIGVGVGCGLGLVLSRKAPQEKRPEPYRLPPTTSRFKRPY